LLGQIEQHQSYLQRQSWASSLERPPLIAIVRQVVVQQALPSQVLGRLLLAGVEQLLSIAPDPPMTVEAEWELPSYQE
jgi:hypothetical protein